MNKMAKGALATGVGVALLLGGGGTLAVWNQSQVVKAGTIVAGDLNLVAGEGAWTNAAGTPVDPASYKVVPGDVLTYTQELDVTLVGDLMEAKLSLDGADNNFANADVSKVVLENSEGVVLDAESLVPSDIPADKSVTATTTFAFNVATVNRDDAQNTADFTALRYTLDQVAPK
ncbi:alternate-type signal peptide domain-containing protein [Arthrobacter sp. Sa2BUA2]|uniref:Alternate-type signal peptide domain-containing protein n=1 Tax=Arthrobacter pullicola TaxID=2762224 RepID=A0ABR8YFS7_9MICC|nr:alternate-type signal peptide domain-containing protein [Arthrobacter pullicola]MBD8043069.1 alternate-type signal peptide domain-containing protein [Arthrobacter pullicola]